jgi:hypothetical protein
MSHDAATDPKTVKLYKQVLQLLIDNNIHFMVGGGISLVRHANIERIHDLDIFCKPGDATKIVSLLRENKIQATMLDDKWIAQLTDGDMKVDFIFSAPNGQATVDDAWFSHAKPTKLFGMPLLLVPPEEVIWSKVYIQHRDRFDGADINHIMLTSGSELNWHRLLERLDAHWELLLGAIINFRFVYPSERDLVPRWLMNELILRVQLQLTIPPPTGKVCRGLLMAPEDYQTDLSEGGFSA